MTTTTFLHPEIMQKFNPFLLSCPTPKLRDFSENLMEFYRKLKKLEKRTKNNIKRHERFLNYENEFLKLYEQITEKEKELEEEARHITKGFGYRFPSIARKGEEVFGRFMFRKRNIEFSDKRRRNDEVSKTQKSK